MEINTINNQIKIEKIVHLNNLSLFFTSDSIVQSRLDKMNMLILLNK